jgi:hypothetical protein
MARMVWGFLQEIFKWNNYPTSHKDFSESWIQGKGPLPTRLILFVFAGFTWAIWTNRNRMAIQHEFPEYSSNIMYSAVTFMQKWSILLKEADRVRTKQVKDNIMLWIGSFKPTVFTSTDVVEI